MIWWLALSTFVFHILQPPWDASTILTNYLNASWEIRYISWAYVTSMRQEISFRFSFFPFPGFLFARLDPRDGDLGKGKSHRSTISLSCTHMDYVWLPTSHNQCVALEWLLVRNESNAFRMPTEYRRLDQPSPPLSILSTLFPWTRSELNVVDARYLRFVLKPRLSVNVERPGSSLND